MNELFKQGEKYNYLTLTGIFEFRHGKHGIRYVQCVCECGNISFKRYNDVKNGNAKSCGCKKKELNREASTKHGLTSKKGKHPIYISWEEMKRRCYNKKSDQYKDYGGRGITVCDEWREHPEVFYKWALDNGWEEGLTIDRIENDGNYEPSNCRWSDRPTQLRNTRRNINLTIFGETKCLQDWVSDERCIVGQRTLRARIKVSNWNPEEAISTPVVSHTERRTYKLSKCA